MFLRHLEISFSYCFFIVIVVLGLRLLYFSQGENGGICQCQCVAISPFLKSKYMHRDLNFSYRI